MAAGKAKAAKRVLNAAPANRNTSAVIAFLEAGIADHRAGRIEEARANYETALSLEPNNPDAHQLLGVLCHRAGDVARGLSLLQRAVELDPKNPYSRNNLGGVLQNIGDSIGADREFSEALRLMPKYPDALANRASVLCSMDRYDEAATCARRAIEIDPQHPNAHRNLGRIFMKLKMFVEAETEVRAYLQQNPDHAEEVSNLAYILQQLGRFEEADGLFRRAMILAKDNPMLQQSLKSLLSDGCRSDQERAEFRTALLQNPGMWVIETTVATNLIERGKLEQAQQIIDDILMVFADKANVWSDIGGALVTIGRYQEAERILKRAVELDPVSAPALNNLGNIYLFTSQFDQAIQLARRSLAIDPNSSQTCMTLARALYQNGQKDQAHLMARAALATPSFGIEQMPSVHSIFNALCDFDGMDQLGDVWDNCDRLQLDVLVSMYLNLLPFVRNKSDMEKFSRLVDKWAKKTQGQALQAPLTEVRPPAPDRRIRVGILSSDLRAHSVSRFLLPFIEGYDKSKISIHCYTPLQAHGDTYQARYRKAADDFVFVDNMTPREIASRIRRDGIEILLELGGFTHESRIAAMAYKPAPVQMSWIGYPATCGLKEIDHVVLDRFVSPTDESLMVEQPINMPEAYVCFGVFSDAPINPTLPMDRNGCVTFGTLNNPYKFNRETIALWARIMAQVPNSRFLIVRPEASSVVLCSNLVAEFAKHGIGADRLYLYDNRNDGRDHLSYYNDIDISLDTFPLTGGTTTCEAIWMGVPVVSLVGDYNHQRISYSVLMHCGLEELCVFTPEDYVARAVALAGERDKLAAWRTDLREVMRVSPLCDEQRFVYQFQEMLDQVAQLHGLR